MVKEGDRVLLLSENGDEFIIVAKYGEKFVTHLGMINHDEIIGRPYGSTVMSSKDTLFYILKPGIVEEIFNLKRKTQIVYPKDMGFILLMLDVKEGDRVVEAGVGSGVMTHALARAVGENGKVYAYERREDFLEIAKTNLEKWNVLDRVELKLKDISNGFDEKNIDALFLDVPVPWEYIKQVWNALRGGGRLCIIVPTTNQVQMVLEELYNYPFVKIEVWENLYRSYKPVPQRLRPYDRMVAHTTYMIFAVKVL